MNGIGGVYVAPPGTSYAFVDTLAISADGTRTYAVVSSWDVGFYHVSVIDSDPASATYNRELAKIRTQDTAVSPDGGRTYVLGSDGRSVAVLDTATNSLIGMFTTDLTSGSTTRSIAVAPNRTLYITDAGDNKVYAVTVANPPQQIDEVATSAQCDWWAKAPLRSLRHGLTTTGSFTPSRRLRRRFYTPSQLHKTLMA